MSEKLAGPNHTSWAKGIQQRLQRLGLWGVVDAQKPLDFQVSSASMSPMERRDLSRANREIVESLEPHVLKDLLLTALPSNLWNVLEEKYRDQAYGSVMDKAFEYLEARFDDSQTSIEEHYLTMETRVKTLATMGFTVSEEMQVMVLLQSLKRSPQSAPFVHEMRQLRHPPTLSTVMKRLQRFKATVVDTTKLTTGDSDSAFGADMTSTWASLVQSPTTSIASSEFTEETMHAVARAVHTSSSVDVGVDPSSPSSATLASSSWTHCACSCKGFPIP